MTHARLKLPLVLLTAGTLALAACESTTEPEEEHGDEVEGVVSGPERPDTRDVRW